MSKDKLIEKIKKLLALGTNNPNVHEAQVAMERANKLLRENDMSMTSILDLESEEVGESTGKNVQLWTKYIYSAVSELYHCDYFTQHVTRTRKEHVVVGTASNRTTAILIINYLIKSINNEVKAYPSYKKTPFKNGAALAISHKCDELIARDKVDKGEVIPGTGLVPADIRLVRAKSNEIYLDQYNLTSRKSRGSSMTQTGYDYGSSLSVNPQMSGGHIALT